MKTHQTLAAFGAPLLASIQSAVSQRWRQLVGFALFFRIFESLLCAPLIALIGKWLLGRTVLDSTALVSFLLSPRGLLALVFAATTLLTIRLVEHAGLSVIFFAGFDGRKVSARTAARMVWRRLPALIGVSARFVGIGFLTLLPLLLVAGGFAAWLLPKHDINYYLKLRPPEFLGVAIVIGLTALVTAVIAVALIVRWRWVVQVLLFEQGEAIESFRRSTTLTRGIRAKLTGALLAVSLFSLLLGILASFLGTLSASILLGALGRSVVSLAIAFGVLLLLRTMIGAACTFLGSCADAGVFTALYRERLAMLGGRASLAAAETADNPPQRWLIPAFVVALLILATTATRFALDAISDVRPIEIHAHRGVFTEAPENTLAAIRAAIGAGADYLETDIQLSRDDVLVVVHDSDFSRLGGVAKKVWDLSYDEIRAIPLGRHSAPQYRDEITPTFDALLAEAKGRIRVNIELKYYGDHQPGLARKVVDAVRAHGMLDQVVIQSLEYEPLLEVRKLAPEIPVGYLLSFNAREPSRLEVDFLSVEQNRLNRSFIARAHRRGQQVYAWTVNTSEDMQHQFDLGIDGIITDQSALARQTLDDYLRRPRLERSILQIRTWLAD